MRRILVLSLLVIIGFGLKAQKKPEGLFINSKAPDFALKDQQGNNVKLKDVLRNGPVVLVFYRGHWCPYCNKHLKKLEDSLQLLKDKGAQLIAVTPDQPDHLAQTIEKTKAKYLIVYDHAVKNMKACAVAYDVDEKTLARYKRPHIYLGVNNRQKN